VTATAARRTKSPYALSTPCANCPFRSDVEPYLRASRAREIAAALREFGDFSCHKTTVHVQGPEGMEELVAGPNTKQCAGSLIIQIKSGTPGQLTRISARTGSLDPEALDMDAPVYADLAAFVAAYAAAEGEVVPTATTSEGEVLEFEHCGVVGPECEDPAGFSDYGGARANDDPPTCNPLENCQSCGNAVCEACRAVVVTATAPDGVTYREITCVFCAEEEDEDEA
jgi:hypothetical protein